MTMHLYPNIRIDDIKYTGTMGLTKGGVITLHWYTKPIASHTLYWKLTTNLTNVSCDTTYVKDLSYNDKHKMLFINYKGPVDELLNYWSGDAHETHDIDECITMSFSKTSYERLQKHLERLGFKK